MIPLALPEGQHVCNPRIVSRGPSASRQSRDGHPAGFRGPSDQRKGLKFGLVKELAGGTANQVHVGHGATVNCDVDQVRSRGSETAIGLLDERKTSLRAISDCTKGGAQWRGTVRRCSVSYGRAVVPNQWERLEAPFVGNVEEQAAGLAMNGVGVVALQPAGGARMADLVGPHERL